VFVHVREAACPRKTKIPDEPFAILTNPAIFMLRTRRRLLNQISQKMDRAGEKNHSYIIEHDRRKTFGNGPIPARSSCPLSSIAFAGINRSPQPFALTAVKL
jgi:hypothetical protein